VRVVAELRTLLVTVNGLDGRERCRAQHVHHVAARCIPHYSNLLRF
jgi:hypothetical protein